MSKRNTFSDFIDAAEHLHAAGLSSPAQVSSDGLGGAWLGRTRSCRWVWSGRAPATRVPRIKLGCRGRVGTRPAAPRLPTTPDPARGPTTPDGHLRSLCRWSARGGGSQHVARHLRVRHLGSAVRRRDGLDVRPFSPAHDGRGVWWAGAPLAIRHSRVRAIRKSGPFASQGRFGSAPGPLRSEPAVQEVRQGIRQDAF